MAEMPWSRLFKLASNVFNLVLMFAVLVPPAYLVVSLQHRCAGQQVPRRLVPDMAVTVELSRRWLTDLFAQADPASCEVYLARPVLCVNLILPMCGLRH